MKELLPWILAGVPAIWLLVRLRRRLELSRAKHRSLHGHSRMAKRVARLIPRFEFGPAHFFRADGAPDEVAARRSAGLERLAGFFHARSPESVARLERLADRLPDLAFVSRYRVPFPFSRLVSERLASGVLVERSEGNRIFDIDGNEFIDLTGAYGVNLFGTDFYKQTIAAGQQRVQALGPVLGPYHPVIERNAARLAEISGLDQVSFHMSGTEAVMQAVRLARYHTGRSRIVRFCGAYHGWWDDVQPGIGNPSPPGRVYTLEDMSDATLRVLERRRDIACVLVNPLQALHPNANAPGDGALVASDRRAGFDRDVYTQWLRQLAETCRRAGVVLIFDEIFTGFRLARGGAQQYFGVRADLVTYGKTLGGGLPVGVLCGRHDLMKRYREDRPVDICFARGTFNAHPYVMGAMDAFLERFDSDEIRRHYDNLDTVWDERAGRMNEALGEAGLPLKVANISSVFTVLYQQPSRYNWMLQFYANAEGLLLPWIGTGRLIFNLSFSDREFDRVSARLVAAARSMQADGWWWNGEGRNGPALDNRAIRRMMLKETLAARVGFKRPRHRA